MSDLSKYCVHILGKEGRRRLPHFKLCCIQRAVTAVGVGILYNSGHLPFSILFYWKNVCLQFCMSVCCSKVSDYHANSNFCVEAA